jgi:glycosidase
MGAITWDSHEVIYHILIDRFAGFSSIKNWDEPIFIGGNLRGICKKLDYLEDLGVTALWISPFYKTSAYHGYHITDFFEVDPHFGSKKDIQTLIHQVHTRGMKIIADFVPNHCSRLHPFFIDAQKHKDSPYKDWFFFTNWPDNYLCFLSVTDIPKLRLANTEVFNHILDAALYWLSFGFDGFRLDHVIGPSHRFWKDFVSRIKKEYPSILLIGEAWMQGIQFHELRTIGLKGKYLRWLKGKESDSLLSSYTTILDGVLDFRAQQLIKRFSCSTNFTLNSLKESLNDHYKKYPLNYYLPVFLDNHDMDRFLFSCNGDISLLKNAASLQFSLDQPAIIYYGTEIGMGQKNSIWSRKDHGDILAREPMRWENQNIELLEYYRDIIRKKIK